MLIERENKWIQRRFWKTTAAKGFYNYISSITWFPINEYLI